MAIYLRKKGYKVNRKRVQSLMGILDLAGMASGPATSGFVYLVAINDWYSRKVLVWQLSNTLASSFCAECFEFALAMYGVPEIFNTDQSCQFTATAFIRMYLSGHGIKISIDGRGQALDNIFVERLWRSLKYKDIYLKCSPLTVPKLMAGLSVYFAFYNTEIRKGHTKPLAIKKNCLDNGPLTSPS